MTLEELHEVIKNCTRCPLHKTRRNAVPGEGDIKLGIMIVGEAPGASEDEAGRPFVGAAGQLLTKTLAEVGIQRGDVYITNVVKCRPPGNRPPAREEVEACLPYLLKQISILKPKRVVALGAVSAKTLLGLVGKDVEKVSDVRGKCYPGKIAGVQLEICVTYHPAAVLRNPRLGEDFRRDIATFFKGDLDRYF
ncbi:type-4 uracil-DNA glycosylase [Pyrobaculum sp.]|uniref:type-4 uracil-DNA glycosylase n=1 Tax=Pyrobaculum sp. TaxID=2004705 RepID=UPI003169195E